MNPQQKTFSKVTSPDPHIARRKAILARYPEIRSLYGPNPGSFLMILGLVAVQFTVAWLLRAQSWWVILPAAYFAGAYAAASLYALIHDATHNLVFKNITLNRLTAMIANLPIVTVSAETFRRYHMQHHFSMGDYEMDVGIPTQWEARWVGNHPAKKIFWLAFFIFFQLGRTRKFNVKKQFMNPWMALNFAIILLVDALVLYFWGIRSLLYLFLCFLFSFGFHPLGARVIQEHFIIDDGQETNNFSGRANILECNFGCHNEHHDFPRIPWNRLPKVSRIAGEFYAQLKQHPSRWKLILTFVTNKDWDLYRHAVRTKAAVEA